MTVPTSDNMETKSIWAITYHADDQLPGEEDRMVFFFTRDAAVKYITDNPALFLYRYQNSVFVEKYDEGVGGAVLEEWVTDGAENRLTIMDANAAQQRPKQWSKKTKL